MIEGYREPFAVGFNVDEDNGYPLFAFEPTTNNTAELLTILKRVLAFRKTEAAEKRSKEAAGK